MRSRGSKIASSGGMESSRLTALALAERQVRAQGKRTKAAAEVSKPAHGKSRSVDNSVDLPSTLPAVPSDNQSPSEEVELKKYKAVVRKLILHGTASEIENGEPRHARFVFHSLFKQARHSVVIYSDHLRRVVYEEEGDAMARVWAAVPVIDEARTFLRRADTSLRLLVANKLDGNPKHHGHDHPFLTELIGDEKRQGTIELIIRRRPEKSIFWNFVNNRFAVADENMYRLETSKSGMQAVANFNSPNFASSLRRNFHYLASRALRERGTYHHLFQRGPIEFNVDQENLVDLLPPAIT